MRFSGFSTHQTWSSTCFKMIRIGSSSMRMSAHCRSIPRTMQSNECAVAIALRKLRSRVERNADSSGVSLNQNIRYDCTVNEVGPFAFVFGVVIIADVRIRPAIESAVFDGCDVVRNKIVAERVPLIDRNPDSIGAGIERQADRIANSRSEDAVACAIRVVFIDGGAPFFFAIALIGV